MRISNFNKTWLPKAMLILMIVFLRRTETNFITWIFFIFNVNLILMMIRGGYKPAVHRKTKWLATVTKEWATIVIISDILFIFLIGETPKCGPDQKDSLDRKFEKTFPTIYRYLDFIGFRL